MALQIINAGPGPEKIVEQIQQAIAKALPGSRAEVFCASLGHFEISVTAEEFAGKSRVQQHQLVYSAITPLMSGDAPPVHAVDRLDCRIP